MSSKISEMTAVTNLVGTEQIPAINAALEPIRIPVSAFSAREPYILSLTAAGDFVATSIEGDWNGIEDASVFNPLCSWDAYTNRVTFLTRGIYEIKLITKLECVGGPYITDGPAPWPNIGGSGAVGVGLRNVINVGWNSDVPEMRENVHSTVTQLTDASAPTFFQWTDSFVINSAGYEIGGSADWTSPYVRMYCASNDAEYQSLRFKMLFMATLIKPFAGGYLY
jgi:hypothetical protein